MCTIRPNSVASVSIILNFYTVYTCPIGRYITEKYALIKLCICGYGNHDSAIVVISSKFMAQLDLIMGV